MIRQSIARAYRAFAFLALMIVFSLILDSYASAHALRVGGTGGPLSALRQLGVAFSADHPGLTLRVLPSMGSCGGIRALLDGALDVAVTARPLNAGERTQATLVEIPFARTPVALVTSHPEAAGLSLDAAIHMLIDPQATWPDGTPVRVILRPEKESDYRAIEAALPDLHRAFRDTGQRPDVPVAADDQMNAELAEMMQGSLTVATLLQVQSEGLSLRVLPIDGVAPTLPNLDAGLYPAGKTFFLVVRRNADDVVQEFVDFLRSRDAAARLRRLGAVPLG